MAQIRGKLRLWEQREGEKVIAEGGFFWCPGCEGLHIIRTAGPGAWGFNNDYDKPTFTPSILVTYNGSDAGQDRGDGDRAPAARCHSFVTDGRIQFLSDCTHALAGQTVDLPDLPSQSND